MEKVADYAQIPTKHLTSETTEKGIRTRTYQFTALHKIFADPLNVVIILRYDQKKQKTARITRYRRR